MTKTRRRAGDRTAGAGWQLCCLIDRAEKDVYKRQMELCLKNHVLVVSDEIHSDLIFHGKRHIPTASLSPEIAANVVTGISATKTFNLAGLQALSLIHI